MIGGETGAEELFVAVVNDDVSIRGERLLYHFWGNPRGKNVVLRSDIFWGEVASAIFGSFFDKNEKYPDSFAIKTQNMGQY